MNKPHGTRRSRSNLVRALQAGEHGAVNILIDRHHEGLYWFVFRHIPNEDEAIELT
jgi:hypothetical protein